MKIIISGAIYTNGEELLRPHYSGNYLIVDCTQYLTKKHIKENYRNDFYKEATGKNAFYLTYQGVKYFECEFSPYNTEDMELLSEISEIEFYDNETNF
jgi:hypothetical protein